MKRKNVSLKSFYNNSFKKGEEKVFTVFHTRGTNFVEMNEVIKSQKWKDKKVLDVGCGQVFLPLKLLKRAQKLLE